MRQSALRNCKFRLFLYTVIITEHFLYTLRFYFCFAKAAIRTPVRSESGNFLHVITAQTNTLRLCGMFALSAERSKSQLCFNNFNIDRIAVAFRSN